MQHQWYPAALPDLLGIQNNRGENRTRVDFLSKCTDNVIVDVTEHTFLSFVLVLWSWGAFIAFAFGKFGIFFSFHIVQHCSSCNESSENDGDRNN